MVNAAKIERTEMHTDIERKKQTIAVVGLGLIGASLALALKDTYRIIGCARSRETEAYALSHGIVDEICPVRDMRGADCVIACTPLWVLRQTVQEVYDAVGDTAIITDVGSVKELLKGLPGRLVGGHPMAGTEHSGIEACKRHLFENATYCVVPYENSREKDVVFVENLARCVKAEPLRISAEEHDRAAAVYSHMPHLAAYALSQTAIDGDVSVAGSGFMDTTRIAGSDPAFWTEVCKLNRENVLRATRAYIGELNGLCDLLQNESYPELCARLTMAQQKRKALAASRTAAAELTLFVDVKDEVGSIGGVVSLLIRSGVNIGNMRILNSREGVGGALLLEFATQKDVQAAKKALSDARYTIG